MRSASTSVTELSVRARNTLKCRLRDVVGLLPRSDVETLENLRHLREPRQDTAERVVRLPWGLFEYSLLANLISQYASIVISRGYFFTCSTASRAGLGLDLQERLYLGAANLQRQSQVGDRAA